MIAPFLHIKLPRPSWREFIVYLRQMGAVAAVGTTIVGGTAAGVYIAHEHGPLAPPSTPPTNGNANLWVDTNGGSCGPRVAGSGGPYVDSQACGSFQAAYNASAASGDVIGVAPSTAYASQSMNRASHSQAGPATIFKCMTPHTCRIAGLSLGASGGTDYANFLTFDGLDMTEGFYARANGMPSQTGNWTFKNMHLWGLSDPSSLLNLNNVGPITIQNVELGPACCGAGQSGDGIESGRNPGTISVNRDWNIDHLYIHDIFDSCTRVSAAILAQYGACDGIGWGDCGDPCGGDHVDGMQLWGGMLNFTMTNSRIENINATGAEGQTFFVESQFGGIHTNYTLINNFFGSSPTHNVVLQGCPTCTSVWTGFLHMYYNTIQTKLVLSSSQSVPTFANGFTVEMVGNIANDRGGFGCSYWTPGGSVTPTYSHNQFTAGTCGATDITGTPTYVSTDPYTLNLHLSGAQGAINNGDSTICPSTVGTDIDGTTRPIGAACDIGADEAG